jgi:hypothetical protein
MLESTTLQDHLCIATEIRSLHVESRTPSNCGKIDATESGCLLTGIDGEPITDPAETAFPL